MFIVNNYILAIIFCFITMLCWGSWANTQKLSSEKWPFQLFYWDYSFGILFTTFFFAFTLGSFGDSGRGHEFKSRHWLFKINYKPNR